MRRTAPGYLTETGLWSVCATSLLLVSLHFRLVDGVLCRAVVESIAQEKICGGTKTPTKRSGREEDGNAREWCGDSGQGIPRLPGGNWGNSWLGRARYGRWSVRPGGGVCARREGITPIVWAFELLAQTITPAGARKDGEKKNSPFHPREERKNGNAKKLGKIIRGLCSVRLLGSRAQLSMV